ncbi:organic solvent tolerance protein OstA [Salipiger aestuarii]|uniref:Lipopolysaccharide export system protein LptA n=1 Tax=Salipiger aestuarii TaxID=568098 RepID=A0A327XZ32_9RHOB|nr:LptA/OstA family protein [Salipiger aestuarii]EIE49878.1 hypothetical protein C357_16731 [Citreicella sp. 357]KAA8606512.1 organic solvent tolerance protein OstA [Salipiger aestuarii]KAA8610924.1 organic solvent tolerance protein OstA [Salipiger aestuarii]KAB2541136.1 organic solvent tolerance protein OstA [Salipiger aestuarii]RAK13367.1 lipopolysaccharide export system protein LptA [Salipiger aestuarii]
MYRILTAAIFIALAAPASAQGTSVAFGGMSQDTDAPVEVSADQLAVNQSDGTALYTGNVVIGQGEMRLAAPRVLIFYTEDESRIDRMEASGGVTLVSGEEAAEAERAVYSIDAGTILMTGNVLLTQGSSALTSERMIVNLDDGTAQMTGRVRTVIGNSSDETGQ